MDRYRHRYGCVLVCLHLFFLVVSRSLCLFCTRSGQRQYHFLLLFSMWIMVFCLKEQSFQTDTNISSFQTGICPSSVAYTNISNDTQGGFSFSPIGHSRNKPYGGETNSPCIAKVRTNLLGWDVLRVSISTLYTGPFPSVIFSWGDLNWFTQLSPFFVFPECCRENLFSPHGFKQIGMKVLYWSVNNMKLSSNQWSAAFEISNSNTTGILPK